VLTLSAIVVLNVFGSEALGVGLAVTLILAVVLALAELPGGRVVDESDLTGRC
jgi:hypothetical protein